MESRVYFYRNGQLLSDHKANGLTYIGPDGRTGSVKNTTCRRGILVADPRLPGRMWHVSPLDFGGPVMVKVETGERVTWFALATVEQVKKAGGVVAEGVRYMPHDGRKLDSPHEPFGMHPTHYKGGLLRSVRIADVPYGVARWPSKDPLWADWQKQARADFQRRNPRAV